MVSPIKALGWVNTHFTFVLNQTVFTKGYLNIWLEYSNIDADFIHRHIDGFVSGLQLVDIRNREGGVSGTNLIYRIYTEDTASIPDMEIHPGESVIGLQDCDFSCRIIVSSRPSLDDTTGMVRLYEYEI